MFQSQGRFFWGSNLNIGNRLVPLCFNRRGDSLGEQPGPTGKAADTCLSVSFNRRGDSLGEQQVTNSGPLQMIPCFNRRGDSLGGATR